MTILYRMNERIVRFDSADEIGYEASRIARRYSEVGPPSVTVAYPRFVPPQKLPGAAGPAPDPGGVLAPPRGPWSDPPASVYQEQIRRARVDPGWARPRPQRNVGSCRAGPKASFTAKGYGAEKPSWSLAGSANGTVSQAIPDGGL